LFLLDGFDELLLEGRASGGLQEFLQQVEDFQRVSHHRFLVTGRPLALQGIERLLSQTKSLERVALKPMDDSIRQTWLDKWAAKVGMQEVTNFQQFLQLCPLEIKDNLAREPLLLYLLARMHREQHLNIQNLAVVEGITAKIRIYDESVKWVLDKQRQDENQRVTGLESADLRRFMTEAALCVVQSGNECAKVAMLEARLKDSNDPVAKLIQKAREQPSLAKESEKKVLNNLLTAFYIKPASGDKGGSVEFTHKSFGEFLFAERLMESFLDWTRQVKRRQREEDDVSTEAMDKQIYDLLGYGNLTLEIVSYLRGLWAENSEVDWVRLFERLEHFYLRWCDGEFIDAPPENLPQYKMRLLKEQLPERETHLGLRQVDVYTGLNVMILLLELHRYAKTKDELKDQIVFHPCGKPNTKEFDSSRLLRIIGYGQCLNNLYDYNVMLRVFLSGAYLKEAFLNGIYLARVNLIGANLIGAKLIGAILKNADLRGADLRGAFLSGTCLQGVKWDSETKWANATELHEAVGMSSDLAQNPVFSAAVSLSEGMSWVKEGKVEEAIKAYNQALSIDPNMEITASSWSDLCWYGSLHGRAADVLYAGEKAVNLEPEPNGYQDSRGLARALTGDLAGALADFQAGVDSGEFDDYPEYFKDRRQRWVEALKAGNNPFTPEELEALRQAEG
jgi:tetratricopeptide (TPR) repeat protein